MVFIEFSFSSDMIFLLLYYDDVNISCIVNIADLFHGIFTRIKYKDRVLFLKSRQNINIASYNGHPF